MNKNKFITVTLFLSTVFAQISVDQIRNLTNQQLDQVKSELQENINIDAPVQPTAPEEDPLETE